MRNSNNEHHHGCVSRTGHGRCLCPVEPKVNLLHIPDGFRWKRASRSILIATRDTLHDDEVRRFKVDGSMCQCTMRTLGSGFANSRLCVFAGSSAGCLQQVLARARSAVQPSARRQTLSNTRARMIEGEGYEWTQLHSLVVTGWQLRFVHWLSSTAVFTLLFKVMSRRSRIPQARSAFHN
jgi:hypothetical protein